MVTTIGGIGVVDSTFQYVCGSNGNSMVIHTYESLGDSEENKFNSIVDSCIAGQQNCNIIVYTYLAHPASTWTFKNTDRQYRSLEKVLDTYAQIATRCHLVAYKLTTLEMLTRKLLLRHTHKRCLNSQRLSMRISRTILFNNASGFQTSLP